MAGKKKAPPKKISPAAGEVHRVNLTLTVDEYEKLSEAAKKIPAPVKAVTPTELAKLLVMKGLETETASVSSPAVESR